MRATTLIAAAVAALVGAGVGGLMVAATAGGATTVRVVEVPFEPLSPAVATSPVRTLATTEVALPRDTARAATDDEAPATAAPATEQPTETERAASYAAFLDLEAPDPTWRADLSHALADELTANDLGDTAIRDIECGRSLCRVELNHDDLGARERFMANAPMLPSFRTDGFVNASDDDGAALSTVYIARLDGSLPQLL